MHFVEKRIYKRVDAEFSVDLELGAQTLQTTTVNVSCGGLFLKVDPRYLGGLKELALVIHLPSRSRPVKLTADILRQESQTPCGVAVQFQGLYNDNILEIEKFIKSRVH